MADSKIVLNYTYKRETNKGIGYFEFLEPIESNSKTLVSSNQSQSFVPELTSTYLTPLIIFKIGRTETFINPNEFYLETPN